jgi:hypothetical protein
MSCEMGWALDKPLGPDILIKPLAFLKALGLCAMHECMGWALDIPVKLLAFL